MIDTSSSQNLRRADEIIPSIPDGSYGAGPPTGVPGRHNNTDSTEAGNGQSSSASRQPDRSDTGKQPSYIPPHLFTARRRELQQGSDASEESPAPGSRLLRLNGAKAAEPQLQASLPPADLGDFEEKAEGVIQIGTSGMRIPLYGTSMQSIQEVRSHILHSHG